jgi:hypothetical protein
MEPLVEIFQKAFLEKFWGVVSGSSQKSNPLI